MQCPECASDMIRRSARRKPIDWAASLLGMRPYRCEVCHRRFYHLPDMLIARHPVTRQPGGAPATSPNDTPRKKKKRSSSSASRGKWRSRFERWKQRNSGNVVRHAVVLGALAIALIVFLTLISREWGAGTAP
jgi:hypothetical protein